MPRLAATVIVLTACGADLVRVVPDGAGGKTTAPSDPTFEVVPRIAGLRDPLPVNGASVDFVDLAAALGQAIVRTIAPRRDSVLTVELIAGDASYKDTRLSVSLVARATLRSRLGNDFIAQTQVLCRDGAITDAEAGARVMWSCMTHLAQDLGGWLEGLPH